MSDDLRRAVLNARRTAMLNPTGEHCSRCGTVADGYARINDDRLCHGDADRPSCYELASRETLSRDVAYVEVTERPATPFGIWSA